MKVYGIGSTEGYIDATLYVGDDADEEILWSCHDQCDVFLSDEEVIANGLPNFLTIRFNVTRESFVVSQTNDYAVYDIIHDMMQDMYPNWVPTIRGNVSIYANDEERPEDARFDPRNEPEDAGYYNVMEYER